MPRPIIHLSSIAGPCRAILDRLGMRAYREIVELAQEAVGEGYRVTARPLLMNPAFDESRGGRRDDARRRQDIEHSLSDDRVLAVVALRGGAWLTRLLDEVDFSGLQRRSTPVFLFGFSEFTTLINIAAVHPQARAYYDHDLGHLLPGAGNYREAFKEFLADLVGIIEGRGSARPLSGRLVRGTLRARQVVRVVGGCLPVVVTLLGSRFQGCIDPAGRWLALEDVDADLSEIDRQFAQLKLAGFFQRCEGLLLGDFHSEDDHEGWVDQTPAVLELLKFHLPAGKRVPIVAQCNFGHCHPAGALPINRAVELVRGRGPQRSRIDLVEQT